MIIRTFVITVLIFCSASAWSQEAQAKLPEPYKLLPGDAIDVSVWKEPDLQRDIVIRPDGRFSFPLVGDVVAVGKSVTEIQQELVVKLERFIPEAVLTVSVIEARGSKIYVIGQVQRPGEYIVNPMVDVVQALSVAGGMTPFAAVNDVIILRREGSQQTVLRFRFGEVEKGRNLEQNVQLKPGDVVVVP